MIEELERLGVPSQRQTLLVAGGLERRAGSRELEALLAPAAARALPRPRRGARRRGPTTSLDLGEAGRTPLRVNRHLAETDLVVSVTAAETVLHGGAGALLGASGPETSARRERVLAARDGGRRAAGSSGSRSSERSPRGCP